MINTPLTNDEIRRLAPAAFATKPNPKVSSRYGFISTAEVLDGLRNHGWVPVRARQSYTRIAENAPFTRHEIVLRRPDEKPTLELGDLLTETRLINSHGTESCYHTVGGLYRLACKNGAVASAGSEFWVRVRHTIHSVEGVLEAVMQVGEKLPRLVSTAAEWSKIQLTQEQIIAYGQTALEIRYGQNQDKWPTKPSFIGNHVNRQADAGNNLWSVFNRVQENVTRNGSVPRHLIGRTTRRMSIRSVKSIDSDLKINSKLWEAASQLALAA